MDTFAGTEAHTDAKGSFSQQTKAAVDNYEGKKVGEEASFVEASRIKKDLLQYNPWDASWRPLSVGGWYSYNEILQKLDAIITVLGPKYSNRVTERVIAMPVHPPIESTCEDKALEWFGFALGKSKVAQAVACHPYLIGGGAALVVGVVGLVVLSPYANLASQVLSMRSGIKRKSRKKRRR